MDFLITDRDAGWAVAERLAAVMKKVSDWYNRPGSVGSAAEVFEDNDSALAAYAAAKAARGTVESGKQLVGVAYNPNPEGRT